MKENILAIFVYVAANFQILNHGKHLNIRNFEYESNICPTLITQWRSTLMQSEARAHDADLFSCI